MMHDPFQAYATLGSNYGMQTPFGSPYGQQGAGFNPIGQLGGFQQGGQQQFGQQYPSQGLIGPQQVQQQLQQLQLVSALSSLGIPPLLAAALVNNPQIAASLHSSVNPNLGQHFGSQQYSPYPQIGQLGSPFGQPGYPLAPQSWIGQAGLFGGAQGFGGIQPQFSQWGQRPFQAQGLSPWGY